MVRLGLIVMVLVLTGCSALGDAFSGDQQVAGTAAGQTLTVDRLANVVGRAQRIFFPSRRRHTRCSCNSRPLNVKRKAKLVRHLLLPGSFARTLRALARAEEK